ncbi:hypothetical protein APA_4456 [Pseudanabaena sp. lw0831]|nr:hypothetical protein [Pseudanabaena sp. lw0831]GBO56126.1 hypothetical protein APA_4456 [Pseudanabaena sp. lw0831]
MQFLAYGFKTRTAIGDRATSSTSLSAIVRVSVESVKIVNSLPPLNER